MSYTIRSSSTLHCFDRPLKTDKAQIDRRAVANVLLQLPDDDDSVSCSIEIAFELRGAIVDG